MKEVYALGGSIITENLDKLEEYGDVFSSKDHQFAIITGAGKLKKNIEAVPDQINQGKKDMIGIKATRLNAETLKAVTESHPQTPETPEEIQTIASTGQNLVMGGLTPGYSTDAVAAITAELTNADRLIIASNIDGIYDREPEKDGAKRLEKVKVEKIREMIKGNNKAGRYDLIDSTALQIIERSKINAKIILGTPENLQNPEDVKGTKILY